MSSKACLQAGAFSGSMLGRASLRRRDDDDDGPLFSMKPPDARRGTLTFSDNGSPVLDVHNPGAALDFSPYTAVQHTESRREDDSYLFSQHNSDALTTYITPDRERFLSEFEHYEELGRGDFGSVSAATCCSDGQRYAIKHSRKQCAGETEVQHRLQEVYALSAIRVSPHVLRYYDAWVEDSRLFISTELVSGGTARQLLQGSAWSEVALWDLMLQVAVGLQTIHASNIAHLDIKPDNILCDRDPETGRVLFKIGDFGLARPLEISDSSSTFVGLNDDEGDARYLCPALLQRPSEPKLQEADAYALGMTLADLAGVDPRQLRASNDYSGLTALGFSDKLVSVIRRLTHWEPEERPTAYEIITVAYNALDALGEHSSECDEEIRLRMAANEELQRELYALADALRHQSP